MEPRTLAIRISFATDRIDTLYPIGRIEQIVANSLLKALENRDYLAIANTPLQKLAIQLELSESDALRNIKEYLRGERRLTIKEAEYLREFMGDFSKATSNYAHVECQKQE
jgi:hypothetical protein